MQSLNRILVPVDFSESSRTALEYAALLGARFGAEVDVLYVWNPPDQVATRLELLSEFALSEAGHKMRDWLSSFTDLSYVEGHGRLATGGQRDVSTAIVEIAETEKYDLVVMGTHGNHGLAHLLRGSVTDDVKKHAPCPVITIHAVGPHMHVGAQPS